MRIYNTDCISGSKQYLTDEEVDIVLCDPPFGIQESTFDKHYNRKEENVIDGYVEAPPDYKSFTMAWMSEAMRVLKPTGSMYVVSGWTNLKFVLEAIDEVGFHTINHLIWKFNFGVFCSRKYVSSHYHILYLKKTPKDKVTFNTHCRFTSERDASGSPLYRDMEDVWTINKEYQPGKVKNKNKLPDKLVEKMIAYSSNPGDIVADFFLGNFTTAFVALKMGRVPVGFEINPISYEHNMKLIRQMYPNDSAPSNS